MRCYAPFCKTTAETVTGSAGVTLHEFPSDSHLRSAWLRALGRQDTSLPDLAVVCSQHFLNDEFYETEFGSRQICAGAIPSTVQVCMICLDTESKLYLMSKHKLEEAYQHLTGYPPCDLGNLKQTLCVHCTQRLINFSRFRDKSLRARELLMDLVQQHEIITRLHIKKINRTRHELKSNMVATTLAPDHCYLHILEDMKSESEDIIDTGVKTEAKDDLTFANVELKVINEDDHADSANDEFGAPNEEYSSYHSIKIEAQPLDDASLIDLNRKAAVCPQGAVTQDIFKCESPPYQCTLCFKEFVVAHVYLQHLTTHRQIAAAGECGATLCGPAAQPQSDDPQELSDDPHPSGLLPHPMWASGSVPACRATNDETKVRPAEEDDSHVAQDVPASGVAAEDVSCQATSQNEARATCTFCKFTCSQKSNLASHMRTHTGEKPFSCELCDFKFSQKSNLKRHMRTHTSEKPYCCELCEYKCSNQRHLVNHMRTHTGGKPHSCKLCEYKSLHKTSFVNHMRTHTGDKPFSCELCKRKFSQKIHLVSHMRTHTGEKPFTCELCEHKFSHKSDLLKHMRIHTGEKPYSCELCKYKCSHKNQLISHMRTHTGEKPYCCELCEYKCSQKTNLLRHVRTHTGEKPYSCELCKYKCSKKHSLVNHMRTHTGDKPSCSRSAGECSARNRLPTR